jgi:hypothetical protein
MFCVAATAVDTQYFVFLLDSSRVESLNLSVCCQSAKHGEKLMITVIYCYEMYGLWLRANLHSSDSCSYETVCVMNNSMGQIN